MKIVLELPQEANTLLRSKSVMEHLMLATGQSGSGPSTTLCRQMAIATSSWKYWVLVLATLCDWFDTLIILFIILFKLCIKGSAGEIIRTQILQKLD